MTPASLGGYLLLGLVLLFIALPLVMAWLLTRYDWDEHGRPWRKHK